eukprot:3152077-Amphidinium_carterae.1
MQLRSSSERSMPSTQPATLPWFHAFAGSRIHTFWFLVCVLTSAPGILYAAVKAVPGFLEVSGLWRWVLGNAVTVFSGVIASFGHDFLAGKISGAKVDGALLQLAGLLMTSLLLP